MYLVFVTRTDDLSKVQVTRKPRSANHAIDRSPFLTGLRPPTRSPTLGVGRYIVSSGLHSHGRGGRQLGFSVDALSKTMGPDEICERIDAFVPWFRETVASMSQEVRAAHWGQD